MSIKVPSFFCLFLLMYPMLSAQIEVTEVTDPELNTIDITGVAIGTSGETLIFGGKKVFRFDGNELTEAFTCDDCYEIVSIVAFHDTLYIANNFGGLYKRVGDVITYVADLEAGTLAVDKNGIVYGNDSGDGFFRWDGHESQQWDESNSNLPTDWVYDLAVDTNGLLWMATHVGLVSFNGTTFSHKSVPDDLSATFYDINIDRKNAVWVSSAYGGVGRFANNTWTTFPQTFTPVQLVQDVGLLFGEEIWTASFNKGVYRYRNNQFVNYTPSDLGYSELESCTFVTGDAQGRLWMKCNNTPLFYIITEQTALDDPQSVSKVTVAPNPASDEVFFSVASDQAPMAGITIYSAEGRLSFSSAVSSMHQFRMSLEGLSSGIYFVMVTDTEGNRKTQRLVVK